MVVGINSIYLFIYLFAIMIITSNFKARAIGEETSRNQMAYKRGHLEFEYLKIYWRNVSAAWPIRIAKIRIPTSFS